MSDSEPLVSVFVPTYNHEEYIEEAIESALQQEYENLEIVIGDDCSTDSTWDIISRYEAEYPEVITAFRNKENLGVTGNCNRVLKHCSGKFIAMHSGDDVMLPNKISKQVEVLESTPNCGFCYHNTEDFASETGKTIQRWNSRNDQPPRREDSVEAARSILEKQNSHVPPTSVMVYREGIPEPRFDDRVSVVSDWLFFLTYIMEYGGEVAYIDDVLSRRRIHDTNVSSDISSYDSDQYLALAIVEVNYPELRSAVLSYRGYLYYRRGVESIMAGEYETGRKMMIEQVRYSVHSWKWLGWWLYSWILQYRILKPDGEKQKSLLG
ncbi:MULTISPECIES: glycosyltransferase [Halorussus]|uniref:glycosyltransferase family 2 protein n=1 Tax=Halorussus TaxID=1070314 RepID=UPI000E21061F|nr:MULTISPECIES: glycosyltransferase [Halorussus]NHN60120.1 glycosyltransferase [Halorussus sp. JP-T4]